MGELKHGHAESEEKSTHVPSPSREGETAGPRRLRSSELLGGDGRVAIEHRGELYTLRQTRNGRLILTK